MARTIRVARASFGDRPAFDTAVSRAVLQRASAGAIGETLRLHRPGDIVAFGRQDVVSPHYREAVRAARETGFEAVERLAGGRAAVFTPDTIAFSWAIPDPDPKETVTPRFRELAELITAALHRLGVDARIGEIPGEYCPGTWSVNAGGRRKLMGVGQRLARNAAHVGGVIVVRDAGRVRRVLVPVYRALRLEWDPDTAGSIEDEIGPITYQEAESALLHELASRFRLEEGELEDETLALAERLTPEHRSPV